MEVVGRLLNEAMGISEEEDEADLEEDEGDGDITDRNIVDADESEIYHEVEVITAQDSQQGAYQDEQSPQIKRKFEAIQDITSPSSTIPAAAAIDSTSPNSTTPVIQESLISPEQRALDFNSLLTDFNISPFSSWIIEEPKISHDLRFTAITNSKERKSLFQKYCTLKTAQVLEERKLKSSDARDIYLELVHEVVNVRTRFDDFSRRYKRDARFVRFTNVNERHQIFKDHILHLKNGG